MRHRGETGESWGSIDGSIRRQSEGLDIHRAHSWEDLCRWLGNFVSFQRLKWADGTI